MELFKLTNKSLTHLDEEFFTNERAMHDFVATHLKTLFGLKFLCNEFRVGSLRIDTLAWDEEYSAFVIIEYKNVINYSVTDQVNEYMYLLNKHKAQFILEYQEQTDKRLKVSDVKWENSSMLIIAPEFTDRQIKAATNLRDSKSNFLHLCEISKCDDIVALEYKVPQDVTDNPFPPGDHTDDISETDSQFEDNSYSSDENVDKKNNIKYQDSEDKHISRLDDNGKKLWCLLTEQLSTFTDTELIARKFYISWKLGSDMICGFYFEQEEDSIWIHIDRKIRKAVNNDSLSDMFSLNDPKELAEASTAQWGKRKEQYRYGLWLESVYDLDYVVGLLKQKYDYIKSIRRK